MITVYRVEGHHLIPLPDPALIPEEVDREIRWVDLLSPTEEEKRRVERAFSIVMPSWETMQEIETTSRLFVQNEAYYMTVTLLVRALDQNPKMINVTFILHDNMLVTLRYDEPSSFGIFSRWVTNRPTILVGQAISLLIGLLEIFVDRSADILESFSGKIEQISQEIFSEKEKKDLPAILGKIGRQERAVSGTRESLISINRMLGFVRAQVHGAEREYSARLRNLDLDVAALADHTTFLGNKVNFLLDASFGLISINQNNIIKIFSVAAVVFLPPTLIASIYGMNFRNIPELDWILGYPLAIGLMVLSSILPYRYFKRRGWL